MVQAGFAHANHLATEIRQEMHGFHQEIINLLSNLEQNEGNANESNMTDLADTGVTKSIANVSDLKGLITMVKGLHKKLESVESRLGKHSSGGGGLEPKTGTNKKTPDNPRFTRSKTDKYCWTHGGCAHESKDCTQKAPGHKDSATFGDKMGGSKGFCS